MGADDLLDQGGARTRHADDENRPLAGLAGARQPLQQAAIEALRDLGHPLFNLGDVEGQAGPVDGVGLSEAVKGPVELAPRLQRRGERKQHLAALVRLELVEGFGLTAQKLEPCIGLWPCAGDRREPDEVVVRLSQVRLEADRAPYGCGRLVELALGL
jgi:hypothetical protein